MKTITLPIPTLGEIIKDQLQNDLNRCREIIVSIKNDIKESFTKAYSVCWDNKRTRHQEETPQKSLPDKPETEDDKEIKRLEAQIQNIKRKQEMQEKLDKKIIELESMNKNLERQTDQVNRQKDEISKLQKEIEDLWK